MIIERWQPRLSKTYLLNNPPVAEQVTTSKQVGHNTVYYETVSGKKVYRHYATDIVTKLPNGHLILNTDGHFSPTTKQRINSFSPVGVRQESGFWYWLVRGGVPRREGVYFDGIEFDENLQPVNLPNEQSQEDLRADVKRKKRLIARYIREMRKLETLPAPNNGDCWGCLLKDKDGKTGMGEDHLLSHLEEKYIHGSLILNAIREAGYKEGAIAWLTRWYTDRPMEWSKDSVIRAVRKHFKKHLGLV